MHQIERGKPATSPEFGFLFDGLRYFRLPERGKGSATYTDWSHWTPHGTVQIVALSGRGNGAVAVAFRGEMLAVDFYPARVARLIADGKFDADFGIAATAIGIPGEIKTWNNQATGPVLMLPVEPSFYGS